MSKGKIFIKASEQNSDITSNTAEVDVIYEDTNDNEDDVRGRTHITDIYKINYKQIYKFLLSLLAGNKMTLEQVLQLAKIMFKEGVRTAEMASFKSKSKITARNVSEQQVRSR